jgi:DNA modification methylase
MHIRDRVKELKRIRARDLRPNPRNWRTHPLAQQNALRGVLAEVGYADALLAREADDGGLVLIDGHLRAEVTPDSVVPVLVLDVSDDEADKLLASLDPLSEMAERDATKLDDLLRSIKTDSDALRSLIADLASSNGLGNINDVTEDTAPAPPKVPVTQHGDLWLLGRHRLLCGDSTNADDVGKLLDGAKPFLMVTDQPYGVQYNAKWRHDAGINKSQQIGRVANDSRDSWCSAFRYFPGSVAYVWHSALHHAALERALAVLHFEVRAQIIWLKRRIVISRGHYHWRHEPCLYATRKNGGPAKWNGGRKQSTVWADIVDDHAAGNDRFAFKVDDATVYAFDGSQTTVWEISHDKPVGGGHSTQKPVECMARPMRLHGGGDDAIYDPFVGSGSTVSAAEQLDRTCYAQELLPAYCDVVVERWQALTGGRATRK